MIISRIVRFVHSILITESSRCYAGRRWKYAHVNLRWSNRCVDKMENILFDSTYSAEVAHSGLSRIMNHGQTHISTMHIREYSASDKMSITTNTDVYSYDMVLLEIIAGRRRNMKVTTASTNHHVRQSGLVLPIAIVSDIAIRQLYGRRGSVAQGNRGQR